MDERVGCCDILLHGQLKMGIFSRDVIRSIDLQCLDFGCTSLDTGPYLLHSTITTFNTEEFKTLHLKTVLHCDMDRFITYRGSAYCRKSHMDTECSEQCWKLRAFD